MSLVPAEKTWVPLTPRERRVAGVLVEKQKTTPEAYPMSIAAIATGSNQKTNRDPITNYDADDVEETLQGLRKKGAAVMIEGSGRVVKWKHTLYDWLGLRNRPVEMAVIAELLLRGKQTEGDLRSRAARMESIPDLESLQAVLKTLQDLDLVVYLTPPGQRRGAVVTHNLYPPAELAAIRQDFARTAPVYEDEPRIARHESPATAGSEPGWKAEGASLRADFAAMQAELVSLRAEVEALRGQVGELSTTLLDLKSSLGA